MLFLDEVNVKLGKPGRWNGAIEIRQMLLRNCQKYSFPGNECKTALSLSE